MVVSHSHVPAPPTRWLRVLATPACGLCDVSGIRWNGFDPKHDGGRQLGGATHVERVAGSSQTRDLCGNGQMRALNPLAKRSPGGNPNQSVKSRDELVRAASGDK